MLKRACHERLFLPLSLIPHPLQGRAQLRLLPLRGLLS